MGGKADGRLEVNDRISGYLKQERLSGPARIDAVRFGLCEIGFRFAGVTVTVLTTLELFDQEQARCVIHAENRCRTEGSLQICKVVGEVVADCVCDESGILVKTENGLELVCRSDGGAESYSVEFCGDTV